MSRPSILVVTLLAALVVVEACSKVPITGRRQMNLMGESTLIGMSATHYAEFLGENKPLPDGDPRVQQVRRIGNQIAQSAAAYLMEHGEGRRVQGFQWEFNVVEDKSVNAWCMPGGRVVFYTGILPLTATDNGLAVVMGHEVAHAIARHGNERMSQGLALYAGGTTVDVLMNDKPSLARDIFLMSVGIGGQLGMLAYSRTHETEADKMGLIFMAMAGYDPREAPRFWERMSAQGGGAAPPELLSTHPSDQRRMQDLEAYMPKALKYYKP